jgi:prefoldin subunit 5
MATSNEEITRLQVERAKISETIATVLDFPKKLSYDCMLPLSKMAFMPAKMVHTNEFLVLPEKQGTAVKDYKIDKELSLAEIRQVGKWHSYSESAELLMDRIASIDKRIEELKIPTNSRNANKTVEQNPAQSAPKIAVNQTDTRKDLNSHKNREHSVEDSEETDEVQSSTGMEGIFEIREFIDNDGNETKHEIVNLHEEMEQIEKKLGSLAEKSGSSVPSSSSKKVDDIKAFVSTLNRPLPNNRDGEQFGKSDQEFEDGDRVKTSRSNPLDVLERLEDLEREEDEMTLEAEAADRIRQQERELQLKALPQASAGGWQKGFFSKTPSRAPVPPPQNPPQLMNILSKKEARNVAFSDSPSQSQTIMSTNASVSSVSNVHSKGIESASPESNAQSALQNSNVAKTEKRDKGVLKKNTPVSKAFSGNVMERFP